MRQFVGLRLLQAVVGIGVIGAAILLVGVEEQVVQPRRQVVMVRDILLRSPLHVDPVEPVLHRAEAPHERGGLQGILPALPGRIAGHQLDQPHDVVAVDGQSPVHVHFARGERGVADDAAGDARIGEADGDVPERRVGRSEGCGGLSGPVEGELATLDGAAEEHVDQRHEEATMP